MLISSICAGLILHYYSSENAATGFLLIFIIAFFANIGSIYFLARKYEPPYNLESESNEKVNNENFKSQKIRSFILFDSLSEYSISILAPLVVLYQLRDLNFNYLDLTIFTTVSQLVALFSMRYWGKITDKYGTVPTIKKITSFISVFMPISWYMTYFLLENISF